MGELIAINFNQVNVITKEEFTYGELIHNVNCLAAGLQAQGLVKCGQCVAMALPNGVEFVITMLAISQLGASVSLINPTYTARKQAYFIDFQVIQNLSSLLQESSIMFLKSTMLVCGFAHQNLFQYFPKLIKMKLSLSIVQIKNYHSGIPFLSLVSQGSYKQFPSMYLKTLLPCHSPAGRRVCPRESCLLITTS